MDKQYYLGIGLGLFFLFTIVILIIIFYFLIKNKMKHKQNKDNENNAELIKSLKETCKANNIIFIDKTDLKYDKNKYIYLNGPLLISDEAIILTHPLYFDNPVNGNCIEREWYKEINNTTKQKMFPNPILKEEQIIKNLLNILPKNIPLLVLFIFVNEQNNNDIYNVPGHILFYKKSDLSDAFKQIKDELSPIFDDETKTKIAQKIKSIAINK